MRYLLLTILILVSLSAYCQRDTALKLDRVVYSRDLPKEEQRKLLAVDYADDSIKFTIALFDANNDSIYNSPATDMVVIAPYKSDSVYTHISSSVALINWQLQVVVEARGRKYRVKLIDASNNEIHIQRIKSKHTRPDAKLFEHLPDIGFRTFNNKRDSFPLLQQKNKYTYVLFWGTWSESSLKALAEMKMIHQLYGDVVTFISMDFADNDTAAVRKFITEKNYKWAQGISTQHINEEFSQKGFPFGDLFAPDGTLVKQGMTVDGLKQFLGKKYHYRPMPRKKPL
jgi:hypothetical protein